MHTGEIDPHYCHQHLKSAFVEVKFYSHKDSSVSIEYDGKHIVRGRAPRTVLELAS